jgi:hypothetical protein
MMAQREDDTFPYVDRRAFAVGTLPDEREYWHRQTPQQRLAHTERLRRINYGTRATERLQRVLEFAQREPR